MNVSSANTHVCFILLPGFALTSFSVAIEALSVANVQHHKTLYTYSICSPAGQKGDTISSSNYVPIQLTDNISNIEQADLLIICAYTGAAKFNDNLFFSQLRRCHQLNKTIAATSSGAFILAKAGLLKGKSCTLNPEDKTTFRELFPAITLQENLFTVTENLITSAGGTATLDMMLYLIGVDHGQAVIHEVAKAFMQSRIRSRDEMQSSQRHLGLRIKSPSLGAAVELMERNIEQPYTVSEIADRIGTTARNLERVFQRYQQMPPSKYYMQLRLLQAKRLLQETSLSIGRISEATGFSSQSHFGKCFKDYFDASPSAFRNT